MRPLVLRMILRAIGERVLLLQVGHVGGMATNATAGKPMAQSKEERGHRGNSFMGADLTPAFTNPMLTIFADMSATFLEVFATAQKDWADFVQRRTREDVALTRQLLKSHSLADMHQIYSQYLQTAFQQYRDQSEKVVERSESLAQHLAETTEVSAKEVARARH